MKKKLIFVTEALWIGGIETSLVNLLNQMDYEKYDVTCLILRNDQTLAPQLPKQVRLLVADRHGAVSFENPYRYARLYHLTEESQNPSRLHKAMMWAVPAIKWLENRLYIRYIRKNLPNDRYDTAVIYDNRTAESVIRAVNSSKYLMLYHQGVMSHAYHDILGWKKADKIIAVSAPVAQRLCSFMPKYADKVITINNIIDVNAVKQKSLETADVRFDNTKINIVSCGRLSEEKGMHIALDACAELKRRGFLNFSWYFIGDGREKNKLSQQIWELQISDCAFMLGQKSNPFPCMKQADLFVQTSLFESYGLSLAEAMILGIPVVSTRTDGSIELTKNGEFGQLCDIDSNSVADAIAPLLESSKERYALKEAASGVDFEQKNSEIMKILTQIL